MEYTTHQKSLNYKGFIEDWLSIVDKEGEVVPFNLNPIQDRFLKEMSGKDIVLKARQQGFSSIILAVFLCDFLYKPNTYNIVVADDADNASGLLKRVKDYLQFWATKSKINLKEVLKYNSKYELYYAGNNSTYHIGTAQNTQFGRSRTITNLHLSEVAFYPHIAEILAGSVQAVVPTGRIILETTANGFNEFKEFWDKSKLGQTPYKPHFYPAQDFYSQDFLDKRRQELGRLYPQEYPATDLEAFVTSGDTYFDKEALAWYLTMVKKEYKYEL